MAECTVYSPCGRYVVRLTSNAQQQRLFVDVRTNSMQPTSQTLTPSITRAVSPNAATTTGPASATTTPGIVWSHRHAAAVVSPLHLVASLDEADIVALTASAGVRKNFASFAKMLYDALIGRSACVHFYVETVAEMKERIQRDVQRQQGQQRGGSAAPSPSVEREPRVGGAGGTSGTAAQQAAEAAATSLGVAAARVQAGGGSSLCRSEGGASNNAQRSREQRGRVCAAVGDTVIELDEDIADDVLEQRFLTVDYDVDFTRAIFPIPLSEATSTTETEGDLPQAAAAAAPAVPAEEAASAVAEAEERLDPELRRALARVAALDAENAKLRRENAALVQLSKQKMHEMQRLCDDFQQRVHGAAEAERLRTQNAELRMQLQGALEDRQTALRTLERERSQHRRLGTPVAPRGRSSNAVRGGSSSGGGGGGSVSSARRRSASGDGANNPYLRSLSRDSACGGEGGRGDGPPQQQPYSRRGSRGSHDAQLDRHGRPLLSPTPTPTSRRRTSKSTNAATPSPLAAAPPHHRRSTRFDTPPGPSTQDLARHSRLASSHGGSTSTQRRARAASTRSANTNCGGGGGGGDSPAPRDRTGGRQAAVVKPRRSRSNGDGRVRSRASSSSSSVPRRGPSLWADTSDQLSARGSVASSRGSSASHERLYRATTASSRHHQTPKAYALEELGARRAVFH